MRDARLDKLARVLVQYSTRVAPGDLVRIAGESITEPLLIAVFREVLAAGGHPIIQLTPDGCSELMLKYGNDDQLRYVNPVAMQEVEVIDVSISAWGELNTKALSRTDPQRQAMRGQARRPYLARFMERFGEGALRWVGAQFPCHASAQDAEMSLSDYEEFVFRGGMLHQRRSRRRLAKTQRTTATHGRPAEHRPRAAICHAARHRSDRRG